MARASRSLWLWMHIGVIVSHIALIIAGIVAFVVTGTNSTNDVSTEGMGQPGWYDQQVSQMNSDTQHTVLPWAAAAIGIVGTGINGILFLYHLATRRQRFGTEQNNYTKKQIAFGLSWFFGFIILCGDLGIAIGIGLNTGGYPVLTAPCAIAAICSYVKPLPDLFSTNSRQNNQSCYDRCRYFCLH
jgi:hypothetical protein